MAYQSPFFIPGARLVGLVWTIGGAAMFFGAGSRVAAGWGSQDWPHVQGSIVKSSVFPTGTAAGGFTYYKTDIVYEYSPPFHDGYTHVLQGIRASYRGFIDAKDNSYDLEGARLLTGSYPLGRHLPVYYNPQNFHDAVLRPGVDFGTFGGSVMGLIAVLLGISLILFIDILTERLMTFFCRAFP